MSKLSNELIMLKLLMNHRKYTISELSEKLEVSPRMIRIYKDDLEKAGFFIESFLGKNGGYLLYEDSLLPQLKISKYDIELLKSVECKVKDKILKQNLIILTEKLQYNYNYIVKIATNFPNNILSKELINIISSCTKKRRKMKIWYLSLNGEIKERIIEPFGIFLHGKDDWVVAAYCNLRGEVRIFNLNRIKEYKILKEQF